MAIIKSRNPEKIRLFIFFGILFLFFVALAAFPRVAIPLTVAYVISLIFKPGIPLLKRFGLSESLSVNLIFASILILFTYPVVKIAPVVTNEAQNLQYYLPKVEKFLKKEYHSVRIKVEETTGYQIGNEILFDSLKFGKG